MKWRLPAGVLLVSLPLALLAQLPEVAAEPEDGVIFQGSLDVLWLESELPALARVSGGPFRMGSSPEQIEAAFADCKREPRERQCRLDHYGDERPVREVVLSAFFMMRHEVTVRDHAQCERARRCEPTPYFRGANRFRRDDYPASLVSFEDARAYCAFWGGRLPTEAEFERAARGRRGRIYPWGNLYHHRASNHGRLATDRTSSEDGYAELAPVGSFPEGATPEGVFDLAGNVAEWVWDRYAPEYSERDLVDPRGPAAGAGSSQRVVRGGSYQSPRPELRGAARDASPPSTRLPTLGFRCVRPVAEPRVEPETHPGAGRAP